MEEVELDLATIKTRSITGVFTLISRSLVLQLVSSLGFLVLTTFLGRPEIGLFIAVNDLVSILGYFSDVGLAASLVQKKSKVSLVELRTVFTLQMALVTAAVVVTLLISPWLVGYYGISTGGTWLLYSLLISFFLASLKTIPSVVLERQLKFEVLAVVEVWETVIFYVIAVVLAWQGFGITAYVLAVLARGVLGVVVLYYLASWPMGLAWSWESLRQLLTFGVPYQLNSLMAVIKDRFLNLFLWKTIGADGVGIIGWAQTWSQKPLRFVMDNVTRVTFPAYARLQDHPDQLRHGIEQTLFFITAITFPILALFSLGAPHLVALVPKWAKWQVAIIPLWLYCFNSAWASISTPLTNVLNALHRVKVNSLLMIMWTALTWTLVPWLATRFGYVGVAYAVAIISLSSLVPVVIVKYLTHFNLMNSFVKPSLAASVMMVVGLVSPFWWPVTLALAGLVYIAVLWLLGGRELTTGLVKLYGAVGKK